MLLITHNGGFFSCSSYRLYHIIEFFNKNRHLPNIVDSSKQYQWYKLDDNKNNDISYHYFKNNKNKIIKFNKNIRYDLRSQYLDYKYIRYTDLKPFMRKYFSPSNEILNIINDLIKKYKINYKRTCAVFYRGNDKKRETKLCSYDKIIEQTKLIQNKYPKVRFLIQSDETQFIDKLTSIYNNSFYMNDEIRHMNKCNNTVDKVFNNPFLYSKYFLAIIIIMSKCRYIICNHSGNCSLFICLFRGNNKNVKQYYNNNFI